MTIGDKIKKIRTFRNMTQAELGAALGWGDKGANRLAQYETNYRVPRKDLVTEMAKILDVNPLALHEPTTMDASELMIISILISSHHLLIYAYLYDMYSVYDSVRNVNKVILQFIKIYHIKFSKNQRNPTCQPA